MSSDTYKGSHSPSFLSSSFEEYYYTMQTPFMMFVETAELGGTFCNLESSLNQYRYKSQTKSPLITPNITFALGMIKLRLVQAQEILSLVSLSQFFRSGNQSNQRLLT